MAVAETQRHCRNASSTRSSSILKEKVRSLLQSTRHSIQGTLYQGVGICIFVKLRELGLHCKAITPIRSQYSLTLHSTTHVQQSSSRYGCVCAGMNLRLLKQNPPTAGSFDESGLLGHTWILASQVLSSFASAASINLSEFRLYNDLQKPLCKFQKLLFLSLIQIPCVPCHDCLDCIAVEGYKPRASLLSLNCFLFLLLPSTTNKN